MSQSLQSLQDNVVTRTVKPADSSTTSILNEYAANLLGSNAQQALAGPIAAVALSAMNKPLLPTTQYTHAELQAGVKKATQAAHAAAQAAQHLYTHHHHQQHLYTHPPKPRSMLAGFGGEPGFSGVYGDGLTPNQLPSSQNINQALLNQKAAVMLSAAAAASSVSGKQYGAKGVLDESVSGQSSNSGNGSGSGGDSGSRFVEKVQAKRAANRLHSRQSRKRKKDFIESLKEQTELLQRTKAMLEILPFIILAHNPEGVITHAIAATKRLLDYTATEICGMDFYRILGKDSVDVAQRACHAFSDDGSDCSTSSDEATVQVSVLKRNGEELLFEMDTKRPSKDEIVRYLQLAKSNMSSSSSSSSEDGCRTSSSSSSMGTSFYNSSEEEARSSPNNANSDSNGSNDGSNFPERISNDGSGDSKEESGSNEVSRDEKTFCQFTQRGGKDKKKRPSEDPASATSPKDPANEQQGSKKRKMKKSSPSSSTSDSRPNFSRSLNCDNADEGLQERYRSWRKK